MDLLAEHDETKEPTTTKEFITTRELLAPKESWQGFPHEIMVYQDGNQRMFIDETQKVIYNLST
jgi:hypothetical protein